MLNHYRKKEQENRAVTTLAKRTYQADERSSQGFEETSNHATLETSSVLSLSTEQIEPPEDQYSGGWFDGLIGEKPRYPELKVYWSGYQQGLREYYANLAGIELANDC